MTNTIETKTEKPIAEKEICVNCGKKTRDIPRCDYTIAENIENNWNHPEGGYICDGCEEGFYAEAHREGEKYCPEHGFVSSHFDMKDDNGNFIGCFKGCQSAIDYDREVMQSSSTGFSHH